MTKSNKIKLLEVENKALQEKVVERDKNYAVMHAVISRQRRELDRMETRNSKDRNMVEASIIMMRVSNEVLMEKLPPANKDSFVTFGEGEVEKIEKAISYGALPDPPADLAVDIATGDH